MYKYVYIYTHIYIYIYILPTQTMHYFMEIHQTYYFASSLILPKRVPSTDLGSRMSINGGDVSTSKDVAVTMATWSLQHWVKMELNAQALLVSSSVKIYLNLNV